MLAAIETTARSSCTASELFVRRRSTVSANTASTRLMARCHAMRSRYDLRGLFCTPHPTPVPPTLQHQNRAMIVISERDILLTLTRTLPHNGAMSEYHIEKL